MTRTLILLAAVTLALVGWAARPAPAQEPQPAGAARVGEGPAEQSAAHGGAVAGAAGEGASHEGAARAGAHDAGPVPPADVHHRWPGVLLVVIAIMFFAAAVIGPIVRAQAPPEMPPTHSHDEPPGASHHHGHTGTINPVPEDVARLEQGHGPHDH